MRENLCVRVKRTPIARGKLSLEGDRLVCFNELMSTREQDSGRNKLLPATVILRGPSCVLTP